MSKFSLIQTVGLPVVESSGGLVINDNHHLLIIFKRGSWDLPKGRIDDKDINAEINALREVQEETGLTIQKIANYWQITAFLAPNSPWIAVLLKKNGLVFDALSWQ